MNFFNKCLFAVHGIAMDEEQSRALGALIWCPASNYFLLNKTANIEKLKTKTSILFGTDSTLTASWNLWEHLRLARKTNMMSDSELFETLTETPLKIWKTNNIGTIAPNKNADIVIARIGNNKGFDAFYSLNPEDILLVLHEGGISLIDEIFYNKLLAYNPVLKNFYKISVNGIYKYIHGNLPGLIKEIKKYNPKANIPGTIF